ncbi:MAG: hypothetical protein RL497_1646 [Pseudomonadota bacterium]
MKTILQLNSQDNIALALDDLVTGEQVNNTGAAPLTILQPIAKMHKVAVAPIVKGAAIKKYGQVIGFAAENILPGAHVHTHNCSMGAVDKNYDFCRNAQPTAYFSAQEMRYFQGYKRSNGAVGTRNFIGILTTVNCSATVAKQVAQYFSASVMQAWPNVDGVVALTHSSGCGMRTEDEGYATLQRTFEGFMRQPNFGGLILIGLGCETMQIKNVLADAGLCENNTVAAFDIQAVGGTRKAIEQGIRLVESILPQVNQCVRTQVPASELIIGLQCGGSDAFSGITANPALGIASDLIVRLGGTVFLSETPEIYGAEHLLTQRAQSPEVAEKLLARIRWWEDYTQRNGFELDNNPSPGNKQGGLTTILEKSLGAQTKGGATNLVDVCLYAEAPKTRGLIFMDSPGYDPVSVTGQVASGANVICFTTGRGSAFGCKPVPSIKLSSNTAIYQRMQEDIDLDCGPVIDGAISLEAMGGAIVDKILAIASGEYAKSEDLGYGDMEFNPWKIGAVL